jgi:uncharacterized metal-binding protein YceD (DUF177 family)
LTPDPDLKLWNVPVRADDVPETGRHVKLSADAATRTAIAAHAGLRSLDRLEAAFDVTRRGRDGLRVTGEVSADVGQVCVVTLEPVDSTVSERLDVDFLPASATAHGKTLADTVDEGGEELPEVLKDGSVDLGALAVEFLMLGLDPYPRKPDVEFAAPQVENAASGPFAALAKLKPDPKRQN